MPHDRFGAGRRAREHTRTSPAGHGGGRIDELRMQRERTRIAQRAARLIAEHGITDWALAKRKAARELMLPDSAAMPSNEDLEQALTDHHALFGGEAHRRSLSEQRREALTWMQRLARWEPLLVGGVAAGWASAHSDVRLELLADDPKAVEIELASAGIAYAASTPSEDGDRANGFIQLRIATAGPAIRLVILTPAQRRNRPRRDGEPRLTAAAVAALLAAP